MLTITVTGEEDWDEINEVFVPAIKPTTLRLEHSLISLSKWESKWKVPYLTTEQTTEQAQDYVRCMTLTQNVDPEVYSRVDKRILDEVGDYISDPMSATWFSEDKGKRPAHRNGRMMGEVITAEIVYYWMISANIPMECEKWHLNRLLTLIRVINEKNTPPKKMSKGEIMRRNAALNAKRKAKLGTHG